MSDGVSFPREYIETDREIDHGPESSSLATSVSQSVKSSWYTLSTQLRGSTLSLRNALHLFSRNLILALLVAILEKE